MVQLGFSSKIKVPQLGSARNFHSLAWLEPENSSLGSSLFFRFLEKQTQDEIRRAKERLDAVKQKEVNVDQNLSEHEQMLEVWSFMLD